jgi:NAD+ synthase (glutamine-hydrolysing)
MIENRSLSGQGPLGPTVVVPSDTHAGDAISSHTAPMRQELNWDIPITKIAGVQFDPTTGAMQENSERIGRFITDLHSKGVQLAVFTEAAVTGYCFGDYLLYDEAIVENKVWALEIARNTPPGIVAVFGFVDYDPNQRNEDGSMRKYNAAMVACDGEVLKIVHKVNLPNYGVFDDKRHYHPGEIVEPVEVIINGQTCKLGVLICEDAWDDEYTRKVVHELNEKGADFFVCINASPAGVGKLEKRMEIVERHVRETGKLFIYNNTSGVGDIGKDIISFDGQTIIYGPTGHPIAHGAAFTEDTVSVDLKESIGANIYVPRLPAVALAYETLRNVPTPRCAPL